MSAARLVSLLCCASALMCGVASAKTPRVVKVAVAVEARQFTDMLEDAQRRTIETTVATAIAEALAFRYPIVDWRVDPGTDVPAATLTAAVVEFRAPGSNPNAEPQIDLVWRARSGDRPFDMPDIAPIALYKPSIATRPVDDHNGKFTRALAEATVGWFTSETNRNAFKPQFLRHVLLANQVVAANAPYVVVPLSYQRVKMHRNSVLQVEYPNAPPPGAVPGGFTLTAIAAGQGPQDGNTQARVASCGLDGTERSPEEHWAKCMPPLTASPTRVVSVYAADYIYEAHPDVEDGVIGGQ